ncbi:MAG: UDP-N-acetylmuramate dehydrogenase [Rikenellaceae bacterium]
MNIIKDKNLKTLNTFSFDVKASEYAEFENLEQLREILRTAKSEKWYLLSGGSNTLFSSNYQGLVIHPVGRAISVERENDNEAFVKVEAGVVWDDFVCYALDHGFYGAENLSIIPGLVGAAPVQNIGAYGVEAKDVIESVEVYMLDQDEVVTLNAEDCMFGYRDSVFKKELHGKAIVLSVLFRMSKSFIPVLKYGNLTSVVGEVGTFTAHELREKIIEIRESKLPDYKVIGNGGSFFKNPIVSENIANDLKTQYPTMPSYPDEKGVKIPAGWLIEQMGWKGVRRGDAGVYEKQALVLVNFGSASPKEVLMLANDIINSVKEKFGILISPEINII